MIFFAGCSVIKPGRNKNYVIPNNIISDKLFERIKKQNITLNNFYIPKAEIEISSQEGIQKVLGSVKFEKPDKYLISIKSNTGIEIARIFISDDTILINDRINRKQYYGSSHNLKSKYGITNSVLPALFGDYITDNLYENKTICTNDKLDDIGLIDGIKIKYIIDCKKGKIISAIPEKRMNEQNIEIKYSDFIKNDNVFSPRKIEINEFQKRIKININIKRIEPGWRGKVEFINGPRYELIPLL